MEPTAASQAPLSWQQFRQQMPVTQHWVYLDHAAVSPLPEPSARAIAQWAQDVCHHGDVNWSRWDRTIEVIRQHFARLLGAEREEVAVVRNTTEGVNLVAEGFPWRQGDNVVVPVAEFPSNRFAWMNLENRGVEVRLVEAEHPSRLLEQIAAACDRRTRIVTLSWVEYATGYRHDLARAAEIAHACGALLFVDAIQGLGVFPLDVHALGIDFLAADGHKWLLGPEGAGVFFLRREHLELLRPLGLGWNSVEGRGDYSRRTMPLRPTAARYEGGSFPMAGMVGLAESLKLVAALEPRRLEQRVLELAQVLKDRLRQAGAQVEDYPREHQSGIVPFAWPGANPQQLWRRLREKKVVLSARGGRLRASPHGYNTPEDFQRLIEALRELASLG